MSLPLDGYLIMRAEQGRSDARHASCCNAFAPSPLRDGYVIEVLS